MKVSSSVRVSSVSNNDAMSAIGGNGASAAPAAVQDVATAQRVEIAQDFQLKLTNEHQALKEAVDHANKAIEGSDRSFKYEMHKPTNQVIVTVIDNNTREVLKEIPSRKLLDVVGKLMELAGVLVDERR